VAAEVLLATLVLLGDAINIIGLRVHIDDDAGRLIGARVGPPL
jgi:hypothetical protein